MRPYSYEGLRDEAQTDVGIEWLSLGRALAARVVRSYDPNVYSDTKAWTDQSIEDVASEFVADQLIRDGQAAWMVLRSDSVEDIERMSVRLIKRVLARRRQQTVIDRLLTRSRSILNSAPFVHDGERRERRWALTSDHFSDALPGPGQLRKAAQAIRGAPVVVQKRPTRSPKVYTDANLEAVLRAVAIELDGPFRLSDLDSIFTLVLTGWLPTILERGVMTSSEVMTTVSPEEEVLVTTSLTAALAAMDDDDRTIMRMKLANESDELLAAELRVSRPTVAKRKKAVWDRLRSEIDSLSPAAQALFLERLAIEVLPR